ncbi:hypothetical protein [Cryptosporangium aurantiacum]|nr:hypothetical protein [Cryptosporangium aurantiacum]
MTVAFLLVMAAFVRLLTVTEGHLDGSGAALGLLVGLLALPPLTGVVWAAAGGSVYAAGVGVGPRLWYHQFASGRFVQVGALPFAVYVGGFGAAAGRRPQTPFRVMLAFAAAVGVAGLATVAVTTSGLLFGLGAAALICVTSYFADRRPVAPLPAALSEFEARSRARLTPVVLAVQRRDDAEVVRLTADVPAVPAHWTDSFLLALRAGALAETATATDAVHTLRTALTGPEDAMTPMVRTYLAIALFRAVLRDEVSPEHHASVVDEIRDRATRNAAFARSMELADVLAAQTAYLDGDWPRAIARSRRAARRQPPGHRADPYAIAALAAVANGDRSRAARYLKTARRNNPAARLVQVAATVLETPDRSDGGTALETPTSV